MSCQIQDIFVYPCPGVLPSVKGMRNQTPEDTTTSVRARHLTETAAPRTERRALVIAGAAVAALLTWLVADPILSVDLTVVRAPGSATTATVSAGSIVGSAIIAGLLGWAVLAVLERRSGRGAAIWRWFAAAVAVVSLAGPLTLAQTTGGTVVLTLLHVVVASVLLLALPTAGTASAGRTGASRTGASQTSASQTGTTRAGWTT